MCALPHAHAAPEYGESKRLQQKQGVERQDDDCTDDRCGQPAICELTHGASRQLANETRAMLSRPSSSNTFNEPRKLSDRPRVGGS